MNYSFTLGSTYWTYELQPRYVDPTTMLSTWWTETSIVDSISLDPGETIIAQSNETLPLLGSSYVIQTNALLSMYGIFVNYIPPYQYLFLPDTNMYTTITNLGMQSITIPSGTPICSIISIGTPLLIL